MLGRAFLVSASFLSFAIPLCNLSYPILSIRLQAHILISREYAVQLDVAIMHRCLTIPEILPIIFSNLDDRERYFLITAPNPPSQGSGKKALANAARACRVFQQPALDVLYRELDKFITPIIRTLPRDLLQRTSTQTKHGERHRLVWQQLLHDPCFFLTSMQSLLRPMNTNDWRIFQSYASRVRVIKTHGLYDEIDIEIVRALCSPPAQSPLFPKLVSLAWKDHRDEAWPLLKHCLIHSLVDISLDQTRFGARGNLEIAQLSLVPSIKANCPNVVKADLGSQNLSARALDAASDLICGWHLLEELVCENLSDNAWIHLATIPTLRVLTIKSNSASSPNSAALFHSMATLQQAFPVLEVLHSHNRTLDSLTGLVTLIQQAPLKKLIYWSLDAWKSGDLHSLAKALINSTAERTLQELTVTGRFYTTADRALSIDAFRPFFHFRYLTDITVSTPGVFVWNDKDLEEMSSHFPHLQWLSLGDIEAKSYLQPKVTLAGLVPLLRNCPKLQALGIAIDATILPPAREKPGGDNGVKNSSLGRLYLGDSPIDDPIRVAAFLSAMAPHVNNIYSWEWVKSEYQERWNEVARLIRGFVSVRAQEGKAWFRRQGQARRFDEGIYLISQISAL